MTYLYDFLIRPLFLLWAKSSRAPGYLYQLIEKNGSSFSSKPRNRRTSSGAVFLCDLTDHVQQQIYFFGVYEPVEFSYFQSVIHNGDTVIDAGANVGAYSLPIAKSFNGSVTVHAFEPIPNTFEKLVRNARESKISNGLILNKKALWNKNEILSFHLSKEHKNNIGSFTAGTVSQSLVEVKCETTTLDDYVEQNKIHKVDVIKMDIEGAEKFALEGAKETLKKFKPIVFLEVNEHACKKMGYLKTDLVRPFKELNYRIFKISSDPKSFLEINDVDELIQANVILVPSGRMVEPLKMDLKSLQRRYLT